MSAQTEKHVTVPAQVNSTQVVNRLKEIADYDVIFKAVCLVFAARERARQQVTLVSLQARMMKEGYKYTRKEYEGVLRQLAMLGIGKLAYNKHHEISGLTGIRVTLQSVGKAALGQGTIDKFMPAIDYRDLPVPMKPKAVEAAPTKIAGVPHVKTFPAALTVVVNGDPVTFEFPNGLKADELGRLVSQIYNPEKSA